jgi:hypothetical protein
MFEGVKPFDWLMLFIEVAVVGLILYEIIADGFRRRAEATHRRFIDQQALELMQSLARGRRWLGAVPNTSYCNKPVADQLDTAWIKDVQAWVRDTNSFLQKHSPKASATFMSIADAGHVSTVIGNHPHTYIVRGQAETWYVALTVHLENLQRIVTTPEAYFERS